MFKKTVVAAALACAALHSHAAITLAAAPSAADVVSTIVGSGVTAFGATATWNAGEGRGVNTFSDGAASVGFSDGVVMTTGNMGCVRTGNTNANCTSPATGSLGSTSSVAFSFNIDKTGTLSFVYVFASDEYENAIRNNDVANFFLTGPSGKKDLALGEPSSAESVNCTTKAGQFIDNVNPKCPGSSADTRNIEFDGLTTLVTVTEVLEPGAYTFEFKISDAGTGFGGGLNLFGDSALFIQAKSFTFTTPGDPGTVPEPASWALIGFGLVAAASSRRRRTA